MAGLLDFLFNPGTYSPQGGLLSRLQPSLAEIPQSQGFPGEAAPMNVGGYQMPRMGNADLFQPQQVNIPQNAQPAQGQMPQQDMTFPSNPGGFGAGLRGFVNNLHNGPIGALVGGVGSALGMQDPAQRNQTQLFEAYKQAGLSPAQAYIAALQPQLAQNMLGGGKKSVTGEYSLNPVYGTNEKGETVLLQTGKSGEAIQTKLPAGVKVSSGVEKIDLGTEWGLIDKRTGTLVGKQAKDLAGKERAEEIGKSQGQAAAKLPAALIDAKETTDKIDALLKNEGLDSIVGRVDQYRGSWTLGDKGRDALARLEQLQGGAFLQAFNTLKGGGAITEIEGQKAERAIARMQRYQSEADFKAALMDFRDAVRTGIRKLQAAAGSNGAYPEAIINMQSGGGGSVDDLIKKYGG